MTLDLQVILLLGLASYRLTRFLILEAGPFDVMKRVRLHFEAHEQAELLSCMHCAGVWISLLVFLAWLLGYWWLVLPLAVSGVVSLIRDFAMRP